MFHNLYKQMNISDYLSKQLQSGEDLVQVIRRHPITMFPAIGGGGFIILLDFFFIAWWFKHHQWGALGFFALAILGVSFIVRGVYIWSHNVLAVTTKRVIDIDQQGFFERHVAETTYDKIQDVRYTIRGFWPTILRFGTVLVQTAGTTTNLEMDAVRRPVDVQRLITDLQQASLSKNSTLDSAQKLSKVVDQLKAELGEDEAARVINNSITRPHG